MIYTVTLNPSLDRTLTVEHYAVGGTFKASRSDLLPAGKGINVARVASTLGEPVAALGLVGVAELPIFAAELERSGIQNRLTAVPGATRACVTILDPVGQTQTHVREQGSAPPPDALSCVEGELERVKPGDWVVFAGSLAPGMPADAYRRLIAACASGGGRTLLDAEGPPLVAGVQGSPTALRLNAFELLQLEGDLAGIVTEEQLSRVPLAELVCAARRTQLRGIASVIVSMGERGAVGLDPDGKGWWAHVALDRPALDTVGSGDAFGAGWVVATARGASFPEAMRLGTACGAANALVAGAGRCRHADIKRLAARVAVVGL